MSGCVMFDGWMRGGAGCIRCSCCGGGPLDADAPPASVAQTRAVLCHFASPIMHGPTWIFWTNLTTFLL